MALIDLLIVGLILAVVISRFLKHDLPTDTRPKKDRKFNWQEFAAQIKPVQTTDDTDPAPPPNQRKKAKVVDVKGLSGVELLKATDEAFDEDTFKQGVVKAYQYFHKCWNDMDTEGLDKLCGPDLMDKLNTTLADYKKRGAKPEVLVNSVEVVEIAGARVKAKTAIVDVILEATQSEGERGATKKAATQAQPQTVRVRWVLARALTSGDPNWELQSVVHEGAKA